MIDDAHVFDLETRAGRASPRAYHATGREGIGARPGFLIGARDVLVAVARDEPNRRGGAASRSSIVSASGGAVAALVCRRRGAPSAGSLASLLMRSPVYGTMAVSFLILGFSVLLGKGTGS